MKVLVIDIGNSTTKAAVVTDGVVVWRKTAPTREVIGPAFLWTDFLSEGEADPLVLPTGVSCVVPDALRRLRRSFPDADLTEVNATLALPFAMAYSTPDTMGADRLAAAAAAWNRFGSDDRSVVVVDAGTAVNYEVVRASGVYIGGPIAPGLMPMRNALIGGTSRLPDLELELPERAIGTSTDTALQSGIVFGFVDAVSGMIDRVREELADLEPEASTFTVVTGGDAELLVDCGITANRIETNLVLLGIADLVEASAGRAESD